MKSQRIRLRTSILVAIVAALAGPLSAAEAAPADTVTPATLYVSTTGSDTAPGTADQPLKTLGAALQRATGGQTVVLGAGTFSSATDQKARTTDVTVTGQGTGQTFVTGFGSNGGQHLHLTGITFKGPVKLQGDLVKHNAQPSMAISFSADEFTSPGNACVTIKEGARDISVTDSSIHDCGTGLSGPGNPYISDGIKIERNTISTLTSDAMQIGSWSDVTIDHNTIRSIYDPNNTIHNDGIQLTGSNTNIDIDSNWISGSRDQLIFIQDAIGPIDHVDVVNNVLLHAGAVAVQSQGATHSSFVNNTIYDAKDGGLWLRAGYVRNGTQVIPTDTVMSNNVAPTFRVMEGAATSAASGNVMICPGKYSGQTVPAGATCVSDFGFVNPSAADYRLAPTASTRSRGSTVDLPRTDIDGRERTAPVPGAYN